MRQAIEKLEKENRLLSKTAEKIFNLGQNDQKRIIGFIQSFRLGQNLCREFVGYILDISKRDGIPIAGLVMDTELCSLAENASLPHARKKELLRKALRQRRFERPIEQGSFGVPDLKPQPKQIIYARQKGSWLKRCPGTLDHICCNYLVINSITGCPLDCTYCYLQAYMNKPGITVFTNFDDLIRELRGFFEKNHGSHYRIGTGEFSDSLALDRKIGLSKRLIELFAGQEDHLLELKTKTKEVDHLLDLDHRGKTIFAWSVNPERVVKSEEIKAVSLAERIKASGKCVRAGYPVAFHFDPVIHYAGWEKEYQEVVDHIFSEIGPDKIAWISLGALRYPPQLKDIIGERFPHSQITLGELDKGEDGKIRYLKPIRINIFRELYNKIRKHSKEVYVYLCMESADVWQAIKILNSEKNIYKKTFEFFVKKCYNIL